MKERAPRNRTLIVHEDEKMALMSQPVKFAFVADRLKRA